MKKTINFKAILRKIGIISIAAVIGLSMAALSLTGCSNPSSSNPSPKEDQVKKVMEQFKEQGIVLQDGLPPSDKLTAVGLQGNSEIAKGCDGWYEGSLYILWIGGQSPTTYQNKINQLRQSEEGGWELFGSQEDPALGGYMTALKKEVGGKTYSAEVYFCSKPLQFFGNITFPANSMMVVIGEPKFIVENTNGKLTINGLSAYNGKYAYATVMNSGGNPQLYIDGDIIGLNIGYLMQKHGKITDGSATLKVWMMEGSGTSPKLANYTGNDIAPIMVIIYNTETPGGDSIAVSGISNVNFSGGTGSMTPTF